MTEISDTFSELKRKREGALIGYVTIGDPHPKRTPRLVDALVDGGADMVELGIPFSDPIADGPTIQGAVSRSLANGCRPIDVVEIAETVRQKHNVPLIVMSYFNPIFRIGLPKFVNLARKAGISGLIVPDLAVEESALYKKECSAANVDTIFLATPSTGPDRLKQIITQTSGFLYLVTLYGVTGARSTMADGAVPLIKQTINLTAGAIPLVVGFGISKPTHVKQTLNAGADGAIVASAFVKIIEKNAMNLAKATHDIRNLTKALKQATLPR